MSWSTRELADLAGTTVKAVRHYHQVGLLPEPERAVNGYKQYDVHHLVRLLRVKRLADLGVPLATIAALDDGTDQPADVLHALDLELAGTIERLTHVRSQIAEILDHGAPADLPEGFTRIAANLSDADRALVLIYSRIFAPADLDGLRELLQDYVHDDIDVRFAALPADAGDAEREALVAELLPQIRKVTDRPWLSAAEVAQRAPGVNSTIVEAIRSLYNPAQLDVIARVTAAINPR